MAKCKNPAAQALGRLGGKAGKAKKGMVEGFAAMTLEERLTIQEGGWAARHTQKTHRSRIAPARTLLPGGGWCRHRKEP